MSEIPLIKRLLLDYYSNRKNDATYQGSGRAKRMECSKTKDRHLAKPLKALGGLCGIKIITDLTD